MATRKKASHSGYTDAANDAGKAVSDSAQKIWLAGLGAYEREAADQAMRTMREGTSGAAGRFDKLEQVFEDRVSKSLKRLGVLTRGELADLSKQVRDLTADVRKLNAKAKAQKAGAAKRRKPGARKA